MFAACSLAWAGLLAGVPYLEARGPDAPVVRQLAGAVHVAGGVVCHQRADRSFHPWGRRMPVCARCAGLYAAAAPGAAAAALLGLGGWSRRRRLSVRSARWLLAACAAPTAIAWSVEWLGLAALSPATRFVAAWPLGAAVAWVVTTAIREEME